MHETKIALNVMNAPVWERKATMVSGSAQADARTGAAIVSAASASTDIAWANALVM